MAKTLNMTFLQKKSVGKGAEKSYRTAYGELEDFAQENSLALQTHDQVDVATAQFMDFLFFEGHRVEQAEKLIAA
eukprot:2652174-Karenia_brevis.AAC.1